MMNLQVNKRNSSNLYCKGLSDINHDHNMKIGQNLIENL